MHPSVLGRITSVYEFGGSTFAGFATFLLDEQSPRRSPKDTPSSGPDTPPAGDEPEVPAVDPTPGILTPINKCMPFGAWSKESCETYNPQRHANIPQAIARMCDAQKNPTTNKYPKVTCPANNGTCIRCTNGSAAEKDCIFNGSQTDSDCTGYRKITPYPVRPGRTPREPKKEICVALSTICDYDCPENGF